MLLWASPWPLPKYCCVVPLEQGLERPTEASWTGLYYFQNCVFICCPWPTLQALAQGPETRPYVSRPAVSKLSGTATLPVTTEAPLEAKS